MRGRLGFAVAAAAAGAVAAPGDALATFPGQNGRIVFEQGAPLFTVSEDGSNPLQLTALGFNARSPAVSADGNTIAFGRTGGTGYGIWTVAANGTGARQVTTDPVNIAGNDSDPAWSPDGSRIAFVRGSDLFVMNADGSGVTNITPSTFIPSVSDPDWSPDGSQIAFSDGSQIYAIGAGGTPGPTQITPGSAGNRENPSWSPDGTRIAFDLGPSSGIFTTVFGGPPDQTLLVNGLGEVWELAWSPDGTKIAFIQDVGNTVQEELWTVNADGTGVTQLNVDTEITMDWGPASTLPTVPPPVLGQKVNVDVVRGTVLVAVPARGAGAAGARASQKGLRFVPLTAESQIPTGSFLDTSRGTVSLTSATGKGSRTQSGRFDGGIFQVLQSRKRRDKGLTTVRMSGGSFKRCGATVRGGRASAAAVSKRTIRKLRGNAKGRYTTRGKHSAATVRGTIWTVSDRCDGTLTSVKRGKVAVRDFRRKKTVIVRAGKTYLARARR